MSKFLKNINLRTLTNTNIRSINTKVLEQNTNKVTLFDKNLGPYKHVLQAGSNANLVHKLPNAINYWLKISQDKIDAIVEAIDYAWQGVLLFDDVQDGTLFRRNFPSTHRIFGIPLTINSAIYMIGEGCIKTFNLGHQKAPEIFCKNMQDLWNGQGLEIYWRDNYICPTEDEYKAMVEKKTAFLFMLQLELMQLFSENKKDYRNFFFLLALYYQIRDDYCNLAKVAAFEEKFRLQEFKDLKHLLFCEDITEGRFTWPIMHALKTQEGPIIRNILLQHTQDVNIKQHCLSLIEKAGSLEFTRQTLSVLDRKLRDQIEQLGGNPTMITFLDEINNWDKEE